MGFVLIDRIVELRPAERITAVKVLSPNEEYLADHFPLFPVLPGVLMLEAMTQTAAWLLRNDDDFAHSIVVLKEARNVKYADFVEPGQTLTLTAELVKRGPRDADFKTQGTIDGRVCVSARLVLERYNRIETEPDEEEMDAYNKVKMRKLFRRLTEGLATGAAAVAVAEKAR